LQGKEPQGSPPTGSLVPGGKEPVAKGGETGVLQPKWELLFYRKVSEKNSPPQGGREQKGGTIRRRILNGGGLLGNHGPKGGPSGGGGGQVDFPGGGGGVPLQKRTCGKKGLHGLRPSKKVKKTSRPVWEKGCPGGGSRRKKELLSGRKKKRRKEKRLTGEETVVRGRKEGLLFSNRRAAPVTDGGGPLFSVKGEEGPAAYRKVAVFCRRKWGRSEPMATVSAPAVEGEPSSC